MTSSPAIVVDGLVKRYGERAVVDGVSFEVGAGALVALLGPNGAGKTTTVETVEGYRQADGGTVRVLGQDPVAGGRALRARVGLMLQGGGIDPRARPREVLELFGRFHHAPRSAGELLDVMGLGGVATTPYRRLSGGERQRLGLALALVGRPAVLVLDEPTAGMDPEARAVTRDVVAGARRDGASILLTSHDLADVERLADRVVIIDAGRVVANGTPAELVARTAPTIRFRLDRPLDAAMLTVIGHRLRGVTVVPAGETGAYRLEPAGGPAAGGNRFDTAALVASLATALADAGYLIAELRTGGGSLEEAYLAAIEHGRRGGSDLEASR